MFTILFSAFDYNAIEPISDIFLIHTCNYEKCISKDRQAKMANTAKFELIVSLYLVNTENIFIIVLYFKQNIWRYELK